MPVLFISHGAPTFALEPGQLGPQLQALGAALPVPRAVLVVSPHWTAPQARVATTAAPATIHDFRGFPAPLYRLAYPAPGAPAVAARAQALLQAAGWPVQADPARGLDHGAWVPLRYLFPAADVPVFQLAMPAGLDAEGAYALGGALAPLRQEGVLVVGSGSLTHNLYEIGAPGATAADYAQAFADWVRAAVAGRDHAHLRRTLEDAPHAARAHPTTEHFLPLLVAAGAAGDAAPVRVLNGGILYGVLSMESYAFGLHGAAAATPPTLQTPLPA